MVDWVGKKKASNCLINVYIHYGGKFKTAPTLMYTTDEVKVFEDWDIDYISLHELMEMYYSTEDGRGSPPVDIYYQLPLCELDVGVVEIRNDKDVIQLLGAYKGLSQMHVYVEKGELPLQAISPDGKVLFKRVVSCKIPMLTYEEEGEEVEKNSENRGNNIEKQRDEKCENSERGGHVPTCESESESDGRGEGVEHVGNSNEESEDINDHIDCGVGDRNNVMGDKSEISGKCEGVGTGEGFSREGNNVEYDLPFQQTENANTAANESAEEGTSFQNSRKRKASKPVNLTTRKANLKKKKLRRQRKLQKKRGKQKKKKDVKVNQQTGDCEDGQPDAVNEENCEEEADEDYDWLNEGLEGSEDEDIFTTTKSGPKEGCEGTFAARNTNSPEDLRHEDVTPPERTGTQAEFRQEDSEVGENLEDWNEKVELDEDLLDTHCCDEEWDTVGHHPEFNKTVEFGKPSFVLKVGQKFTNVDAFREALVEWHVREGFELWFLKNEKSKVTAVCKRGCNWRIHASPLQGSTTYQIKSLKGTHVCGPEYSNVHANSRYLSKKMQYAVMDDPNVNVGALSNTIRRECMIDVSLKQAYRVRTKSKDILHGVDMEQYNNVRQYAAMLLNHNSGSRVTVKVVKATEESVGIFQRMFYSLGAMKDGFLAGCRPIIGLDGCFLKSPFGGQLLTAMGRDGNDNMYPIALAVVESECFDSWTWFLEELKHQIGDANTARVPWTFISDRQKGLVHAIEEVFSNSEHRYCIRHMYQNFKQKFKGKDLKGLFWAAASASNRPDFRRAMMNLEKADPKEGEKMNAVEWLRKIPPKLWSRAFFSDKCKSDLLVNNLNESFNSYILKARDKPVISMFEWIRRRLMQRINIKKAGMESYEGNLCPNIQDRVERSKNSSRYCIAVYSTIGEYEVDCGGSTHVVKLSDKTCTCGQFQLTGIPCPHAIAAIQKDKRPVEDFVDYAYSKEAYMKAYNYRINPIPSRDYWDEFTSEPIKPPEVRKQPGRPKKMRRREADEPKTTSTRIGLTVHCKRCFKPGHNSRTCKNEVHPKSRFFKSPSGDNGAGTSNVQPSDSQPNAPLNKPTGTTFKGGRFVKKSYKKMNKSVPDPQSEYAREREKIKKSQQSAAPPPNPAANTRFARPPPPGSRIVNGRFVSLPKKLKKKYSDTPSGPSAQPTSQNSVNEMQNTTTECVTPSTGNSSSVKFSSQPQPTFHRRSPREHVYSNSQPAPTLLKGTPSVSSVEETEMLKKARIH